MLIAYSGFGDIVWAKKMSSCRFCLFPNYIPKSARSRLWCLAQLIFPGNIFKTHTDAKLVAVCEFIKLTENKVLNYLGTFKFVANSPSKAML